MSRMIELRAEARAKCISSARHWLGIASGCRADGNLGGVAYALRQAAHGRMGAAAYPPAHREGTGGPAAPPA